MIDYDKLGYCSICHKEIGEFGENGKVIRWKELYQPSFKLDNGSRMIVSSCWRCFEKVTEEQFEPIMTSVIRGWEEELKQTDWSQEKKDEYMKVHSTLKILERID